MQRRSDHWISLALSVLLHAALVAALVYGWLLFRHPPRPKPTLAIEATVVDARALREAQRPAPQPPPPVAPPPQPAQPPPPPQPTPEELAQREAQREEQRAQAAQEEQAAERAAAEEAARAKLEEQRKAEERRKAETERKAQAAAAALAAQHAAETQEQNALEAELKHSLAAEEHATRSAPALANWQAQITAKISRAWLRPPTARAGIECVLNVTQVPGGEVTQVSIGECNGDQAVRESIEAAVYRASPLPPPPDPALFERNLKINFKPD
jgi:colicin import membrane protein